ncbi:hypothetical protein EB077_13925, partial [bacterium]|nr:hypothetical protein [bacterium]
MSFWEDKPLHLTRSNVFTIMSKDDFHNKISNELSNSIIQLDYRRLDLSNKRDFAFALKFINEHYNELDAHNRLQYSPEALGHFINFSEYIALMFYVENVPMGFVIGSVRRIIVYNKRVDTLEASFLCLESAYRGMHVSSYMINVLTLFTLKTFPSVYTGMYTVMKPLRVPHYTKKRYYYKPINIGILSKCGLLYPGPVSVITFSPPPRYKDLSINFENVYRNLQMYLRDNKKVYQVTSKPMVMDTFTNKCFHTFTFNSGEDYICYYSVTICNTSGAICRNGYVYLYYFRDNSPEYIRNILQAVHDYIQTYDLLDLVTYTDPFGLGDIGGLLVPGNDYLYYYLYNIAVPETHPA